MPTVEALLAEGADPSIVDNVLVLRTKYSNDSLSLPSICIICKTA
jgi:hypothetical protein